ncbi:MAG: ABC transporter permease [Candidatus Poribacteria bacterium]|nr:ABC transporter permease [Candidatus Poribacteria bacterium]
MGILESLANALSSLAVNKLRSSLTMLGVIIGVAAIMTTTSIGEGAKADITERIQTLGANILAIRPGQSRFRGRSSGQDRQSLKYEDAMVLRERARNILLVSPEVSSRAQVKHRNKNHNTTVVGTTPEYQITGNFQVEKGAFFTETDVRFRRRVCTLGKTVVDELFGDRIDPIGKTVKIRGLNFRVLGVMKEKGATGWRNPDDQIFIPVSTAMKRVFGRDYLSSISAQVVNSEAMEPAQAEIENLLRKQHKLPANKQLDFNVRNRAEFLETLEESGQTFTYMILGIAIVSLVVGGIGIMNIMLVSVTERTKEIGLRKAVGAKRRDILVQFLIESMTLSVVGGLVGIGVGVLSSRMVPSLLGWRTILSPTYTALAFFVAAWIGIFFGAYPAWKAAKLHPIEALRYE